MDEICYSLNVGYCGMLLQHFFKQKFEVKTLYFKDFQSYNVHETGI